MEIKGKGLRFPGFYSSVARCLLTVMPSACGRDTMPSTQPYSTWPHASPTEEAAEEV